MISLLLALTTCPYPEVAAIALAMLHGEDGWYALYDALLERGISSPHHACKIVYLDAKVKEKRQLTNVQTLRQTKGDFLMEILQVGCKYVFLSIPRFYRGVVEKETLFGWWLTAASAEFLPDADTLTDYIQGKKQGEMLNRRIFVQKESTDVIEL